MAASGTTPRDLLRGFPRIREGLQRGRTATQVDHDLSAPASNRLTRLTAVPDGFTWITDAGQDRVQISSLSGGTDLASAFLGPAPTVPVWVGELSCAALGADVAAYDQQASG